jgi:hypothetical protein
MVQMALLLNKYPSCRIRKLPPLCTERNLRENRLFAPWWAIGGKNRSHNVKNFAEKRTREDELTRSLVNE